jgi:hypothetical protein
MAATPQRNHADEPCTLPPPPPPPPPSKGRLRVEERPLRAQAPLSVAAAPPPPPPPPPPPEADTRPTAAPYGLGEARLTALLDGLHIVGALSLHDRLLPRTRRTFDDVVVDHLVLTAAGVWVIDAKPCSGPLTLTVDGAPGPGQTLTVQDLSGSALLTKLQAKVDGVGTALATLGVGEVPVRGAVCFVDAQPVEGQRPIEARGLLFTWSEQLQPELLEPGPFDEDDRGALLRLLDRSFTPA